jgi:alpha-glucosidase
MLEYTRGDKHLHTAYSFVLLGEQPTPRAMAELMAPWQDCATSVAQAAAWPSWALSNHDAVRVATRWARDDPARAQQLLALLACLRGTLFLYQGEELGLRQSELTYEQLQDPVGRANWPRNRGRDGCRTPMPWRSDAPHAGFTQGAPWLPVDVAQQAMAVDRQEADAGSNLQLTRRLLTLRCAHKALRLGNFDVLQADDKVLLVLRKWKDDAVLCAFNLSPEPVTVSLPSVFTATGDPLTLGPVDWKGQQLQLGPWATMISPVQQPDPDDPHCGVAT